ncbi:hypothetical protein MAM1_0215d08139 [Mucor ambiguus]|uniref:Uncharacterized protein n=1 Tax=Mucor ambiguus TaxID=91626 RepID=A0A0C9MM90_9FUNG|nr:hypothetical protein MAM1_0215d08139 [Mucor ambiguus]
MGYFTKKCNSHDTRHFLTKACFALPPPSCFSLLSTPIAASVVAATVVAAAAAAAASGRECISNIPC